MKTRALIGTYTISRLRLIRVVFIKSNRVRVTCGLLRPTLEACPNLGPMQVRCARMLPGSSKHAQGASECKLNAARRLPQSRSKHARGMPECKPDAARRLFESSSNETSESRFPILSFILKEAESLKMKVLKRHHLSSKGRLGESIERRSLCSIRLPFEHALEHRTPFELLRSSILPARKSFLTTWKCIRPLEDT